MWRCEPTIYSCCAQNRAFFRRLPKTRFNISVKCKRLNICNHSEEPILCAARVSYRGLATKISTTNIAEEKYYVLSNEHIDSFFLLTKCGQKVNRKHTENWKWFKNKCFVVIKYKQNALRLPFFLEFSCKP